MQVNFANGNAQQKSLWLEALHSLLHLPFSELPLVLNVSFVPPSQLVNKGHTNLAETHWTYGSNEADIEVRNDAPGFGGADDLVALAASMGLTYSAPQHFHETATHETAHAAFAALSEEVRLQVVALFGLDTDDVAVLFPEDQAWEDRVGEAIAETFKEAFLPRRLRVFPNRTNIHLSYSKFAEFRDLFRHMHEGGGEEEEVGEGGEEGAWFRTPRVDAMRFGINFNIPESQFRLPLEYPPKGRFDSGLWAAEADIGVPENVFPPNPDYTHGSNTSWFAYLPDAVEARDPMRVPLRGELLFSWPDEDEYPYVGNLFDGLINPESPFPPWLGGGQGGFYAGNAEIAVQDDNGDTYAIHWNLNLSYGGWTNTETKAKVSGYGSGGFKEWKKNGVVIKDEDFDVEFGTSINDYGMSGLDIFHAFEAIGESPSYNVKKAGYFMHAAGSAVRYIFSRESTMADRAYVWDELFSMWVCPLSHEPGEGGEGKDITVTAPGGSIEPTGASSGRRPSSVASGGGSAI